VAGGDPVQFTFDLGMDMSPCWSPDGSSIAFSSNRTGNPDLWIKEVEFVGLNKTSGEEVHLKAYPNPFGSQVTFSYFIASRSHVTLEIIDLQGRVAAILIQEVQAPGQHEITWQATDPSGHRYPDGLYYCRLQAGKEIRNLPLMIQHH